MPSNAFLSPKDVSKLRLIEEVWVSAAYWDDDAVKRYRRLGLLASDGNTISLTESGRRACATKAPILSLYHPI
jgi:hypothetical protein